MRWKGRSAALETTEIWEETSSDLHDATDSESGQWNTPVVPVLESQSVPLSIMPPCPSLLPHPEEMAVLISTNYRGVLSTPSHLTQSSSWKPNHICSAAVNGQHLLGVLLLSHNYVHFLFSTEAIQNNLWEKTLSIYCVQMNLIRAHHQIRWSFPQLRCYITSLGLQDLHCSVSC